MTWHSQRDVADIYKVIDLGDDPRLSMWISLITPAIKRCFFFPVTNRNELGLKVPSLGGDAPG